MVFCEISIFLKEKHVFRVPEGGGQPGAHTRRAYDERGAQKGTGAQRGDSGHPTIDSSNLRNH